MRMHTLATATLFAAACFSPDPTSIDEGGSTGPGPGVPVGSTGGSTSGGRPATSAGASGMSDGSTENPPDPGGTSGPMGTETSDGPPGTTGGDSDAESTGSSSSGEAESTGSTGESLIQHFIFISAETHSADFEGLAGADALCMELGAQTDVDGPWRAVLQDAEHSLESRISIDGEVLRLDGEVVNVDAESFFAGTAENPVDVTETGETPTDTVAWVGAADADCDGWTSSNSSMFGRQALSTNLAQWLTGSSNGPCGLSRSLYCISQPES